jgi:hypothetical protein
MLKIKEGVDLNGLTKEAVTIMKVVTDVYDSFGFDVTITSGLDGKHSKNSKHYTGEALDFRTRDLPSGNQGQEARFITKLLAELLGDDYDVVLEKTHIHVEYDPGGS